MKANELMIGDWIGWLPTWRNDETGEIEWDGDRNHQIIGKVGMLMKDCTTIDYCDDDYCDESIEVEDIGLIPIPLTHEILEKNFPSINGLAWWPQDDAFHCESRTNGDIMVSGQFRYVHQLQQALRLVGIEKEIVL